MTVHVPPVLNEPGLADRIKADPEGLLVECRDRHGDVFTVVVDEGHRLTYVLDPHLFQPLLTSRQVDFSPISRQSKLRFGLGAMVATDEQVRQLSHALTGGLRGSALQETLGRFDQALAASVADVGVGFEVPTRTTLQDLARRTVMPATVEALFGDGVYDEEFIADFEAYSRGLATRFAGSDPTLDTTAAAAERALMARLQPCLSRMDTPVLAGLRERLLSDGVVPMDDRLRTLLMLQWGSMVNLVPTSVWMYASVLSDPSLVGEVRRGGDDGALAGSVATESLRLYSRPNMYRQVVEDFELDVEHRHPVRFTAGDWIALFPRFLHHDRTVYADAEAFDGRRFCPVQEGGETRKPVFEHDGRALRHPTVVFGLGRGRCPGDAYAMAVLERTLVRWVSSFEAHLETSDLPTAVTDTVSSTPGPDADIGVVVVRR